ncbi:hypothetical protein EC957_011411 [Mortierella hygrophila]|uniref:BRISC and BRCA1-A complex member 2 n=1 Tax=Mortierella hygrophila TaxID=979708 RepID=A0A9P6K888_9FUNG|nr:hypothetical protein EC957_011411 [Mortierella hygrophila]
MSIYTMPKNSDLQLSLYLSQALSYLSDHASMTLFSVRKLNVGSSQKVFNPDGSPIADNVQLTMRSSSIGSNSVDLQLFYDPYDWSFPPDIILHGLFMKPSLSDLGLDDTWDHEDPANLSKVLKKLSYMMQHDERQRVARCDNERIQIEFGCLQDQEARDGLLFDPRSRWTYKGNNLDVCCLGSATSSTVIFAVPFYINFQDQGVSQQIKLVAKIQFLISSLVPNDVAAVKSHIEPLSTFDYPDLLRGVPDIGKHEPVMEYTERVSKKITEHYDKIQRRREMKKEMIETLVGTFRQNLLECDFVNYTFASFMLIANRDKGRDGTASAIATFYLSDSFPDEYPKLTLSAPLLPSSSYLPTPEPEVIPIKRYSPRWGAERIVTEIWEQLYDEIPRFYTKALHFASAPSLP